jgi:hypothetical protein
VIRKEPTKPYLLGKKSSVGTTELLFISDKFSFFLVNDLILYTSPIYFILSLPAGSFAFSHCCFVRVETRY